MAEELKLAGPKTPEIEETEGDLKKYKALASCAASEGGKILINVLKKDIADGVEHAISLIKSGSDIEIRATLAKVKSNLDVLRTLNRAPVNAKLAEEELSKLLKDES